MNCEKKMSISKLAETGSKNREKTEMIVKRTNNGHVISFLNDKLDKIKKILESISKTSFNWSPELKELLLSENYITADFPEDDIFSLDRKIIISRIFTSADMYRKILEKALVITLENA